MSERIIAQDVIYELKMGMGKYFGYDLRESEKYDINFERHIKIAKYTFQIRYHEEKNILRKKAISPIWQRMLDIFLTDEE